jgi:hypothetical protein
MQVSIPPHATSSFQGKGGGGEKEKKRKFLSKNEKRRNFWRKKN